MKILASLSYVNGGKGRSAMELCCPGVETGKEKGHSNFLNTYHVSVFIYVISFNSYISSLIEVVSSHFTDRKPDFINQLLIVTQQ